MGASFIEYFIFGFITQLIGGAVLEFLFGIMRHTIDLFDYFGLYIIVALVLGAILAAIPVLMGLTKKNEYLISLAGFVVCCFIDRHSVAAYGYVSGRNTAFISALIIGGCCGIVGLVTGREDDRKEKEKKIKDAYESRTREWYRPVCSEYLEIEDKLEKNSFDRKGSETISPELTYNAIYLYKKKVEFKYQQDAELWQRRYNTHLKKLHHAVAYAFKERSDLNSVRESVAALECLMYADPENREKTSAALKKMKDYLQECEKPVNFLQSDTYGKGTLSFHGESFDDLYSRLTGMRISLYDQEKSIVDAINRELDVHYHQHAGEMLWMAARKEPFHSDAFRAALIVYDQNSAYTISDERKASENLSVEKAEAILARCFKNNKLGGEDLVNSESDTIAAWIKHKAETGSQQDCYALASGFAWLHLFEKEKDVLNMMLKNNMKLSKELQSRLTYLNMRTDSKFHVYDVAADGIFHFDNESSSWEETDYDDFFRTLGLLSRNLNYSLTLTEWTKTIPAEGRKMPSAAQLMEMSSDLVSDYDGEIECMQTKAQAVNLINTVYEHAIVFRFKSERCRCASILLNLDKFGPAINVLLFVLFTPEDGMMPEQLHKYCAALKGNEYVSSFVEALIDMVDEGTKAAGNIY